MSTINPTWTSVDQYFADLLLPANEALDAALALSSAEGLPEIQISPMMAALLPLLAQSIGAQRILEVGTLGGYSTIAMAQSLPETGSITTLEIDPHHAHVAHRNIEHAGLADRVDLRVGIASESLEAIASEQPEPFDFVFIDADKESNPVYLEWALRLSRRGAMIIIDNVTRDGQVIDAHSTDPSIIGTRRVLEMLANDDRVETTALQTVGAKGYDGFAIARVR